MDKVKRAGDLFLGKPDRFRGITVNAKDEPCQDTEHFRSKLERSLHEWKQQGVRGVWFIVDLGQSNWIPILADSGFDFHHAQSGSVSMLKWLPRDEPCQIPPYAHHMVGVGGMVVNDKDELLVVQEKFAAFTQWKLPGGYVDPGEDLWTAAVREVKEETGVDTEFDSLVAMRHSHGFNFNCSDIYVIVRLRPLSSEIRHCDREISECRWMPVAEYLDHDLVHAVNKHFMRKFLEGREAGISIGKDEIELRHKEFVRIQQVYSIKSAPLSEKEQR